MGASMDICPTGESVDVGTMQCASPPKFAHGFIPAPFRKPNTESMTARVSFTCVRKLPQTVHPRKVLRCESC